jgi:hypothetical protein
MDWIRDRTGRTIRSCRVGVRLGFGEILPELGNRSHAWLAHRLFPMAEQVEASAIGVAYGLHKHETSQ